jgi:hypothetical protein
MARSCDLGCPLFGRPLFVARFRRTRRSLRGTEWRHIVEIFEVPIDRGLRDADALSPCRKTRVAAEPAPRRRLVSATVAGLAPATDSLLDHLELLGDVVQFGPRLVLVLHHAGRQILHAGLHMPDRCFIALLSDRNTLLRERSGPRGGVGQHCGGHSYDENTGTPHARRASDRTFQAGSVHWKPLLCRFVPTAHYIWLSRVGICRVLAPFGPILPE